MAVGTSTIGVVMPAMGDSVTEGTVLEWHKHEGDTVKDGETLVEISTDKVDAEVPAPAAGTVSRIHVAEGETVTVGALLAELAAAGADGEAGASDHEPTPDAPHPGAPHPGAPHPVAPHPGESRAPTGDGANASPIARRIAADQGVDLDRVQGSVRGGRISKADVLAAAGDGSPASDVAPAGNGGPASAEPTGAASEAAPISPPVNKPQPLTGAAAALARHMDASRQVPTATSLRTITVTALEQRQEQLKDAGHRVSFTHLIAHAIARVLTEELPVMAHHFVEIDGKPHRLQDGACNLGLAVDLEKADGARTLIVPVIRDAGRLGFAEFVRAYDTLVEKARAGALTADELTGANITLTNPGPIGTIASVPRLMVGQGTIVATGAIGYPPGLGSIGAMIGAEKVMTVTSTYDHRVIQGAESGRFLQAIEARLQDNGFYEQIFADLGVELGELPPPPAPAAAAAAAQTATATPTAGAPATPAAPLSPVDERLLQAVQAASSLVKAHRTHGHLAARLDPLGREPQGDPALDPQPLQLSPELMAKIPARILRMYVPGATLADALPHLRATYCGPIAYEIEHIASHRQRLWLRESIESGQFRTPLTNDESKSLLERLTKVDALERFMHKAYLGQKQFSIEGLDMTVPMIDEIIQLAATRNAREVVIGTA
ncbi:MAG: multifunctional oxoglutarate decarboxylase/oxoglutarate dehydrogenase thiamine pyrophosphate-binding subunit/dihydrolipoyllysine-residue succinyltransferase subunit, partial [Solirubrobacterales bacterium]